MEREEQGDKTGKMSSNQYGQALIIAADDHPFPTLIMAAMLKASAEDMAKLMRDWPDAYVDFKARGHKLVYSEMRDKNEG